MFRLAAFVALLLFAAVGTSWAAQYGTSEEAKAMLEKAVAAVKQDKAKALDMFNKGEGGRLRLPQRPAHSEPPFCSLRACRMSRERIFML
jgi:hypothetical protein